MSRALRSRSTRRRDGAHAGALDRHQSAVTVDPSHEVAVPVERSEGAGRPVGGGVVSGETPIYDATCREVGPPDGPGTDAGEIGERPARFVEPVSTTDDDPDTSDLWLPGCRPSSDAGRS
ncbi:hypothetical protein PHK61_23800 [Actinomycetospora lutea]|uniref:hypothetical protein n=1 Tax=Actinomycetospora lutea TaxID=663604 RepID=UPI00236550AE|nr:hypothetical protein [Actinomycetospora lutea]MDD7941451.1 hypothetical protein [Actinomycetospora lutea]